MGVDAAPQSGLGCTNRSVETGWSRGEKRRSPNGADCSRRDRRRAGGEGGPAPGSRRGEGGVMASQDVAMGGDGPPAAAPAKTRRSGRETAEVILAKYGVLIAFGVMIVV